MGTLRDLAQRSGLFERDPSESPVVTGARDPASWSSQPAPGVSVAPLLGPPPTPPDEEMRRVRASLEAQVLEGETPYVLFRRQLQALEQIVSDPVQRRTVVLATLAVNKIAPASILDSITTHLSCLTKEQGEFETTERRLTIEHETRLKAELEGAGEDLKKKREQLTLLQSEVQRLETVQQTKLLEIDQRQAQAQVVRQAFTTVAVALKDQLTQDQEWLQKT